MYFTTQILNVVVRSLIFSCHSRDSESFFLYPSILAVIFFVKKSMKDTTERYLLIVT